MKTISESLDKFGMPLFEEDLAPEDEMAKLRLQNQFLKTGVRKKDRTITNDIDVAEDVYRLLDEAEDRIQDLTGSSKSQSDLEQAIKATKLKVKDFIDRLAGDTTSVESVDDATICEASFKEYVREIRALKKTKEFEEKYNEATDHRSATNDGRYLGASEWNAAVCRVLSDILGRPVKEPGGTLNAIVSKLVKD